MTCFSPLWKHRSRTRTRTQSQSSWSVCMWTLTSTAPRRSWGSASRWARNPALFVCACVCERVRFFLSWCTDLNWHIKVSRLLGCRADGKLLSATALWSPESPAFNFAAIQPPQQIHVWPDLPAPNFYSARCTKRNSCQVSCLLAFLFFLNPWLMFFVDVFEGHFASSPGKTTCPRRALSLTKWTQWQECTGSNCSARHFNRSVLLPS